MIQNALRNFNYEQDTKDLEKIVLQNILEGDQDRRKAFEDLGVFPTYQILAHDFNMDTTLYRALKMEAIKSLKNLVDYIFQTQNSNLNVSKHIMYDLPELLEEENIQICAFFQLPLREQGMKYRKSCNIRNGIYSSELPQYADTTTEKKPIKVSDKEINFY